jgi:hypothetical protein
MILSWFKPALSNRRLRGETSGSFERLLQMIADLMGIWSLEGYFYRGGLRGLSYAVTTSCYEVAGANCAHVS